MELAERNQEVEVSCGTFSTYLQLTFVLEFLS